MFENFEKNPPHAFLIVGDSKKQTIDFALKISSVKALPHPDIHEYFPEGKTGMHGIHSMRSLLREVTLAPFEAKKKCFIIHDAERMLPSSSHALLKSIEEPPPKTHFFLLTSEKEKILPTIRSRCQILFFPNGKQVLSKIEEDFQTLINNFDPNKLEEFVKELEEQKKENEKKLLQALPSDLTPHQKEIYEKEIEGQITLQHQQTFYSLLDLLLSHFFKKKSMQLFPQIDTLFKKAKLAFERHLSPKFILETLFLYLN